MGKLVKESLNEYNNMSNNLPVVVMIDISGSFPSGTEEKIEEFIDNNSGETIIGFFDVGVREVQYINNGESINWPRDFHGGGGTDFQKPLDWIKRELNDQVSQCIFITDGYAPMPEEPNYDFVWAIMFNDEFAAPWGEVTHIV